MRPMAVRRLAKKNARYRVPLHIGRILPILLAYHPGIKFTPNVPLLI